MMFSLISIAVLVSTIFLPIHAIHHHRCHGDRKSSVASTTPAMTTPSGLTCDKTAGFCTGRQNRECTCFFGRLQVSTNDIFANGNLPGATFLLSPLLNNCSELLNDIGTDGGQNNCYQTSYQKSGDGPPCFCDKKVALPSNATAQPAVEPPPCNSTQCAARSYHYCFCNNVVANTSGIVVLRPIPAHVTDPQVYCYNKVSQPPDVYCYNGGQVCGCEQISGTNESHCVCKSCFECAP